MANAVSDIASNSVDVNKTIDLPPLSFDKSVNVFNKSISCGPVTASVNVDLDGNTQATASVGVAGTGTLVPPKVSRAVFLRLVGCTDRQLDHQLRYYRNLEWQCGRNHGHHRRCRCEFLPRRYLSGCYLSCMQGQVDSGKVTLVNLGIPGESSLLSALRSTPDAYQASTSLVSSQSAHPSRSLPNFLRTSM